MRTREIDAVLDQAYHRAAELAACEIRKHLRCFNLTRHKLGACIHEGLTLNDRPAYEVIGGTPVTDAIREAATYVDRLPEGVKARLDIHL